MYTITPTDYGVHLLLEGRISTIESEAFLAEMKTICEKTWPRGGVFVDMRNLLPLELRPQVNLETIQRLARKAGMIRSVVIVSNPTVAFQFKRIARHSGIYEWERYIPATDSGWEAKGLAWIIDGIDPDADNRPETVTQSQERVKK